MNKKDTQVKYRRMADGEESAVIELVLRTFDEFVAPEFSQEGIDEFKKYASADELKGRVENGDTVLVAEALKTITGIIEIRDLNHVSFLFVDSAFQRKGIARELIDRSISIIKKNVPDIQNITVNSSPNAFSAYEKIGFKKLDDEKTINGIRFIPMELIIDKT